MTRPEWHREGRDWPHRQHSQFVSAGGLRWHVQVMGGGPPLLLLHGTGASGHSFRGLMPRLAERFTVISPDLPGHAFTSAPPSFRPALPTVAAALSALLGELRVAPVLGVGHSAGAALLVQMTLDRAIVPRALFGLAAALVPFRGVATSFFAPAARFLAQSSLAAQVLALRARDRASVERLVRSTGSSIDPVGVELYRRLASRSGHVAAVLEMLAAWDLDPLYDYLPRLTVPLHLLAGATDKAVPLSNQQEIVARTPRARLVVVPGTGHLLHEEQPEAVARLILEVAVEHEAAQPGAGP